MIVLTCRDVGSLMYSRNDLNLKNTGNIIAMQCRDCLTINGSFAGLPLNITSNHLRKTASSGCNTPPSLQSTIDPALLPGGPVKTFSSLYPGIHSHQLPGLYAHGALRELFRSWLFQPPVKPRKCFVLHCNVELVWSRVIGTFVFVCGVGFFIHVSQDLIRLFHLADRVQLILFIILHKRREGYTQPQDLWKVELGWQHGDVSHPCMRIRFPPA